MLAKIVDGIMVQQPIRLERVVNLNKVDTQFQICCRKRWLQRVGVGVVTSQAVTMVPAL